MQRAGLNVPRLPSGAGHDAMVVAARMPAAMLFLCSPRGVSHNPDESVLEDDVALALETGDRVLRELARDRPPLDKVIGGGAVVTSSVSPTVTRASGSANRGGVTEDGIDDGDDPCAGAERQRQR